ncbi:hypothetical protein OBBRIDRAFT_483239 [Obba rivulosa]|uniref:Uncharacterized protein n=1 Tax=Obba rivulosa TaxID=1052685 RepID=A0A8E2AG42_9APHY|nr:hypothetical protein OBBRIDRAFT_483239 [Obba rivulosa]
MKYEHLVPDPQYKPASPLLTCMSPAKHHRRRRATRCGAAVRESGRVRLQRRIIPSAGVVAVVAVRQAARQQQSKHRGRPSQLGEALREQFSLRALYRAPRPAPRGPDVRNTNSRFPRCTGRRQANRDDAACMARSMRWGRYRWGSLRAQQSPDLYKSGGARSGLFFLLRTLRPLHSDAPWASTRAFLEVVSSSQHAPFFASDIPTSLWVISSRQLSPSLVFVSASLEARLL